MNCDNCGVDGEIAYTLKTHPATESNPPAGSEPNSIESAAESIDLQFCSADCLQEWTTVPSVGDGRRSDVDLNRTVRRGPQ